MPLAGMLFILTQVAQGPLRSSRIKCAELELSDAHSGWRAALPNSAQGLCASRTRRAEPGVTRAVAGGGLPAGAAVCDGRLAEDPGCAAAGVPGRAHAAGNHWVCAPAGVMSS